MLFKCKMCGSSLEITSGETVIECEYCGTKQTLPKLDDERRANMYDRANHFRRNNEFDKAMGIYEQILNEDKTDAEAYWSLVLCQYGIEYVEDPASRKRIPTVNRAQFTSIFDDDNYRSALQYADSYQRRIYESEAKTINEIQKNILAISQREEPFDVFICYKETDNNGRRTQDSVLATELYNELTRDGFKVFFSRITLEDKLGSAYEPYIFAALNSAKVMVVLGTRPEYFNAVWVKNEWSRYLGLIKQGQRKMLIPAYKDMDPYDLPEEFSHLQAQDMSKLGFMQDLVHAIQKIAKTDEPKASVVRETVVTNTSGNASTDALLRRMFILLEDGDWTAADTCCEKVLDLDPENGRAYLGKLLIEYKMTTPDKLASCKEEFYLSGNFDKIMKYGDEALKAEALILASEWVYRCANQLMRRAKEIDFKNKSYKDALKDIETIESKYNEAIKRFNQIPQYKDTQQLVEYCQEAIQNRDEYIVELKNHIYDRAIKIMEERRNSETDLQEAVNLLRSIVPWLDAEHQLQVCQKLLDQEREKRIKWKKEEERKEKAVFSIGQFIIIAVVIGISLLLPGCFLFTVCEHWFLLSLLTFVSATVLLVYTSKVCKCQNADLLTFGSYFVSICTIIAQMSITIMMEEVMCGCGEDGTTIYLVFVIPELIGAIAIGVAAYRLKK